MENKNLDIDFDETSINQHFKKSKCLNFYLELKTKYMQNIEKLILFRSRIKFNF